MKAGPCFPIISGFTDAHLRFTPCNERSCAHDGGQEAPTTEGGVCIFCSQVVGTVELYNTTNFT